MCTGVDRPVFERDRYEAELVENSPVGTRLTTVRASDADHGDNAAITYRFSPATISSFADTFLVRNLPQNI